MKKIKPNILIIVTDQLRYDCVGYINKMPVATPNIDRIAFEGMYFDNAYTHIPICCPARQSFLCGKRSETFGALWNYDITLPIPALNPRGYTWPQQLLENGYNTEYIGKWHVNPDYDPTNYGYSKYTHAWEGFQKMRMDKYNSTLKCGWEGCVDTASLEDTHTHYLAQNAVDSIGRLSSEDAPWHLRLDFDEPHLPCCPHESFNEMYPPKKIEKWAGFDDDFTNKPYIQKQQILNWGLESNTWDDWAPIVARYYATITQVDDAVGKVLNCLDELNLSDNTIVVFTTDHGDMCGSHKMLDKHYIMYEDVMKVPFAIRYPGVIKPGSVCHEYVYQFLDLARTIPDIVGMDASINNWHGESLLPLFKGEKIEGWRKEAVASYNGQQFGLYTQRMIVSGDFKYIWNTTDVDELYNMKEDEGELVNLISNEEYAEILSNLRKRLFETLVKDEDLLVSRNSNSWVKRQLLDGRKL